MKREQIAAVALVLTGCSAGSAEPRPQLPEAITRTLPDNILQIETNDMDGQKRPASAVRAMIGQQAMVLTAAHMLNGGIEQCGQENITQPATGHVYAPADQTRVPRSSDESWGLMNWQDAAVIRTTDSLMGTAALKLSTRAVQPGEKLLLASYQDKPTGTNRSIADGPALFDATVVGTYKDKIAVVSGDGTSYGTVKDNEIRSGSSGGAAIVMDTSSPDYGDLAGLTVAEWRGKMSDASIERQFGYSNLADGMYKVSFIEPITETIATRLADAVVPCD
jgi:hypothetical protein